VQTILERKVTPMLPEPTLPKSPAAASARQQPWVMTPLFAVPDGDEPDPLASPVPQAPRRRTAARRPGASVPRVPQAPAARSRRAAAGSRLDAADLLAVTAERLRRALARSFLRYGVPGDLEAAVHAAMNVIEPVLQARDTEIVRLRQLMTGKLPRA
jgi:hypothetical protein